MTDSKIDELHELDLEEAKYCLKIFQAFKTKFDFLSQYQLMQPINCTEQQMIYEKSVNTKKISKLKSFGKLCLTMEKAKIGYSIKAWKSTYITSSNTHIRKTLRQDFISTNTSQVDHFLRGYIENLQSNIITNIKLNKESIGKQKQQALINQFSPNQSIDSKTITDEKTKKAIILIQLYKENCTWFTKNHKDSKNNNFTEAIQNVFGITPDEANINKLIETFDKLTSEELNNCYKEPDLLDKIALLLAKIVPQTKWA